MIGEKQENKSKVWVWILVVVIAIGSGIASYLLLSQEKPDKYTGTVEKVTIAYAKESLASLLAIAQDQGFFVDQGLDLTIKSFKGGKQALTDGLLAGEADMATVADVPIVANSFQRDDFSIVATMGSSDNELRIFARKDSGISKPADLQGKHIATKRASAVHFFLHVFLTHHRLTVDDIKLTFKNSGAKMPAMLASGEIDAFSHREPFIGQAKVLLGDKGVIFEAPGIYRKTFNLVATDSLVEDNPALVKRVLIALLHAEDFARNNPKQSVAIAASALGSHESDIAALWPNIVLRLSLDQALLVSLEDQARWMISSNLTERKTVPNYLDYIYIDALEEVEPRAVTIIR